MKYNIWKILLLISFLNMSITAYAQKDSVMFTVSEMVTFPKSQIDLDSTFQDNARAVSSIREKICLYCAPQSPYKLISVRISGGASPEDPRGLNDRLSFGRAQSLKDYIVEHADMPDSIIRFTYMGPDWTGLRRLAAQDTSLPHKDEVLDAIDDIIEKLDVTEKEKSITHLKRLNKGMPYRYMLENLYPILRASNVSLDFAGADILPVRLTDTAVTTCVLPLGDIHIPDFVPIIVNEPSLFRRPFYMALKTNMLCDALALPNIGVEMYLGKNWTTGAFWTYAWWKTDRRHRYWRYYGGGMNVRKYFGKKAAEKPLQGHHAGVYADVFVYDFEWGGKGIMGGYPGKGIGYDPSFGVGLEYGYSYPIARRFNIDLSLGVGYVRGKVREYRPDNGCYVWQSSKMKNYFGPTKAEVSLVWLIGYGNYNKRNHKQESER